MNSIYEMCTLKRNFWFIVGFITYNELVV